MYINGRLRFNLQCESLYRVEEDVTFIFEVLDFFVSAPEQQIRIGFFRDQNNKFYCLTVNELGKKKHKIDQYKIGFNFVKQTARFYHQNTFFINEFLPEMQGFRIFIDS
uniref:Uncharacterized protein n=1 Tax=Panagrolaimus sp. ES5 TaxID=591445 RepID=A0AC34G2E1_9BILA